MNLSISREIAAQMVVILGVCVGAWMLAVRPKLQELALLESEIATKTAANASSITPELLEQAAKRMQQARLRVAQIESFNQFASDSSRLYGLVMDLADMHGVHVQSLQPTPANKPNPDATFTTMKVDLIVEGPFENVSSFIDSVCGIDAFVKPLSLQLTPTTVNGKPMVSAMFGCAVLNFTLTDALAGMGGKADAKP